MNTDTMKATSIAFERRYLDNSGVEFAVRLKGGVTPEIRIQHINEIDFPVEEIDWLIECLQRIKSELEGQ